MPGRLVSSYYPSPQLNMILTTLRTISGGPTRFLSPDTPRSGQREIITMVEAI